MYEKIYLKILLWNYRYENDKVKRNGYVKRGISWQADPFFTATCMNLILVICFHLGVSGVAISTVISNVISAVMVMIYLYRRDDAFAQATVTFTSQNYARETSDAARKCSG